MDKNKNSKPSVVQFLSQPYPFYYQGKSLWVIIGLLFLMGVLFHYLFEPFVVNTDEHKMAYFWICCLHALAAIIVLIGYSFVLNKPNIEESWTIKKEVKFLFILLFFIGISQFLIRDLIYDNPNNWSLGYFLEEIRNTYLVGILFISILIPLNFSILNAKHIKQANVLNTTGPKFQHNNITIVPIKTSLKNDNFKLDINKFLFAKADGNYVEFYLIEDVIGKSIKRITIKELESILKPYPNIFKPHRSYLINLMHVKGVSGNAQGYKLQFDYCNKVVPVSRNMINHFNTKMQQLD